MYDPPSPSGLLTESPQEAHWGPLRPEFSMPDSQSRLPQLVDAPCVQAQERAAVAGDAHAEMQSPVAAGQHPQTPVS